MLSQAPAIELEELAAGAGEGGTDAPPEGPAVIAIQRDPIRRHPRGIVPRKHLAMEGRHSRRVINSRRVVNSRRVMPSAIPHADTREASGRANN